MAGRFCATEPTPWTGDGVNLPKKVGLVIPQIEDEINSEIE